MVSFLRQDFEYDDLMLIWSRIHYHKYLDRRFPRVLYL